MDAEYSFFLRLGLLLMAEEIARAEADPDRLHRMRAALAKLWAQLVRDYPDANKEASLPADAASLLPHLETRELALRYLIDLAFSNPFTPYEHKVFPNPRWAAIERLAGGLTIVATSSAMEVHALRKAHEAVLASQRPIPWERVAVGAVGLAVVSLVFAPAAVGLLGATGLSGAAAITSMLATLGGGAVASGGLGMAGGLWVLAGTSAIAGSTAALGAAPALKALGSAHATVEIEKLQVSFKTIHLGSIPPDYPSVFKVIQAFAERTQEFRQLLEEERGLNVKGAQRVKDMEDTLDAMERALTWMKKEAVGK